MVQLQPTTMQEPVNSPKARLQKHHPFIDFLCIVLAKACPQSRRLPPMFVCSFITVVPYPSFVTLSTTKIEYFYLVTIIS